MGATSSDEKRWAYYRGVRACIAWLHQRADEMNDPHARAVLNSAAFSLGQSKPAPTTLAVPSPQTAEEKPS